MPVPMKKQKMIIVSLVLLAAGAAATGAYLADSQDLGANIAAVPATPALLAPHEPNEVIVVFADGQGGIGQESSDNTFNSMYTVEDLITDRLQAVLPDADLEIDAGVLFNNREVDLSTRREARLEELREQRENLPNSTLAEQRLVYARAKSSSRSTAELIEAFSADPLIKYAEPNYLYNFPNTRIEPLNLPQATNNENPTDLWNIFDNAAGAGLNADRLWTSRGITGMGSIVAVLDTGVDIDHPDLKPNIWHNFNETNCNDGIDDDKNGFIDDCDGWDFGEKDNSVKGYIFHGTHTAGITAAKKNNIGVVGVAPDARIMPVKVFREDGAARTSDIVDAIDYAWRNNADVISLSLGRKDQCSLIEQQAITRAANAGVFVIASSGNSDPANGLDVPFPNAPAVCPNSFTIGAIDETKTRPDYSNYFESMVDAVAPGGDLTNGILSTMPNGKYGKSSGTSMAAPHIAGLVALLLQIDPTYTPSEVSDLLCANGEDLGTTGRDREYGCGLFQTENLINTIPQTNSSPTPLPSSGFPLPSPPPLPVTAPKISNGRFEPSLLTTKPYAVNLAFSVCDNDNDLDGGSISVFAAGTDTPYPVAPLSWAGRLPTRSVADCENPYPYLLPLTLPDSLTGSKCVDLIVSDRTARKSNKITNICVTVANISDSGTLKITPAYQIIQKGALPQPFQVSGAQGATKYFLDPGLTGMAKNACGDGGNSCGLTAAADVGTAIVTVTDAAGKSLQAKVFVNGSNNGKLTMQKTADKTEIRVGDQIEYTLTFRNNGTTAYTNLVITDDYDEKSVRVVTPLPSGCTDDGKQLNCVIPSLAASAQGQIKYKVTVL